MPLVKPAIPDRAERSRIDRASTLRGVSRMPVDVVINDLSRTGCRFRNDSALPVGALVSLGLSGSGIHQAVIVRADPPFYGCEFLAPIGDADLASASAGTSVIRGFFSWAEPPHPQEGTPGDEDLSFSLRQKVGIILGSAMLFWGLMLLAAWALANAI